MDFSNAVLPLLKPLINSDTADVVEIGLQQMFIDLFNDHLAESLFDANVLSAPQLGSIALVRKSLDDIGVSVINEIIGDKETRLIQKSWLWNHRQKRGFFMLRTLLQIIYKADYQIEPYFHPKATSSSYPADSYVQSDNPDITDTFLTSRILVTIPRDGNPYLPILKKIALSILPARIVVFFKSSSPEQTLLYCYGAITITPDIYVTESDATNIYTINYDAGGA
jgi:hypothetical protein